MNNNKVVNPTFTNIGNTGLNKAAFVKSDLDEIMVKGLKLSKEELEKADVANAFSDSYGDDKIKVNKTGKEIKAGLTTKKGTLSSKKQIVEDKKVAILNELTTLGCKDTPDEIPWQAKDSDDETVKKFGWRTMDKYNIPWNAQQALNKLAKQDSDDEVVKETMNATRQDNELVLTPDQIIKYKKCQMIEKKMREYNDLVDVCYGVEKDLIVIDTMLNNLKDTNSYKLSVKQLQAAGL